MIETKISKTATGKELLVSLSMARRYQHWRSLDGCPRKEGWGEIRCLQIELMRWERANFGLAKSYTSALGIIEELGELEDAGGNLGEWIDAIGDILIYACNLCSKNGLDFETVLDISIEEGPAKLYGILGKIGKLAHVTLKADQGIRGYDDRNVARRDLGIALYRVVAAVVRFALSCGHDPGEIFIEVSAAVMKREWFADSRLGTPLADLTSKATVAGPLMSEPPPLKVAEPMDLRSAILREFPALSGAEVAVCDECGTHADVKLVGACDVGAVVEFVRSGRPAGVTIAIEPDDTYDEHGRPKHSNCRSVVVDFDDLGDPAIVGMGLIEPEES